MSRSYKKVPVCKDSTRKGPTYKSGKQIANRTVRRTANVPNGNAYRKASCSYDISDYSNRLEESELRKEWDNQDSWLHSHFKTYKEAHSWWKKNYLGK